MSTTSFEWAAFALLVFVVIAASIAEIMWLIRRDATDSGKAAGFVLTTDILGLGVAAILSFVSFFVMFMMVMGPAGRGSDIPSWAYGLVIALTAGLTILAIFSLKLLGLLIFKMRRGRLAWKYAAVATGFKLAALTITVALISSTAMFLV